MPQFMMFVLLEVVVWAGPCLMADCVFIEEV